MCCCCCFLPGNRLMQRLILSRLKPEKHQGWLISIKPPELVYNSRCHEATHGKRMLLLTELTPFVPHLLRISCSFQCVLVSELAHTLVSMLTFPVLFWRLPLSVCHVKLYPLILVYLVGCWPFLMSFCGFYLPTSFFWTLGSWNILWWSFIDFLLCYCAFILSWPWVWLFSIRSLYF